MSDCADVAAYLATLHMTGLGDCAVPRDQVPRGRVLWHDLTLMDDYNDIVEDASSTVRDVTRN